MMATKQYQEVLQQLHDMEETPFHANNEEFGGLFRALNAQTTDNLPSVTDIESSLNQLRDATKTFREDAFRGIMRAKNTRARIQPVAFL